MPARLVRLGMPSRRADVSAGLARRRRRAAPFTSAHVGMRKRPFFKSTRASGRRAAARVRSLGAPPPAHPPARGAPNAVAPPRGGPELALGRACRAPAVARGRRGPPCAAPSHRLRRSLAGRPPSRHRLGAARAGLNPCGAKVIFIYDVKKQGSLACAGGGDRWSGRPAAVTSCRAGPYPPTPEVLRRSPTHSVRHAAWGRPA